MQSNDASIVHESQFRTEKKKTAFLCLHKNHEVLQLRKIVQYPKFTRKENELESIKNKLKDVCALAKKNGAHILHTHETKHTPIKKIHSNSQCVNVHIHQIKINAT